MGFFEEDAVLYMARHAHIPHVADVEVDTAQAAAEGGATGLDRPRHGAQVVLALWWHRHVDHVEILAYLLGAPARHHRWLGGRLCPHLDGLLGRGGHLMQQNGTPGAVVQFLAAGLVPGVTQRPHGPTVALHEVGVTFLAVALQIVVG